MVDAAVAVAAQPVDQPSPQPSRGDLYGYDFEELHIGMSEVYGKTITEADIVLFAGISGDINPVHLNHEFAAETMFEGRIAHGMLTASFISTAIGTKLPGPGCIYVAQNLRFKAPVRVGDTVNAQVTVTGLDESKRMVSLKTVCSVGERIVIDGDATILVPVHD
jgi:3-hydroxybutyryl-CoA dehydratase